MEFMITHHGSAIRAESCTYRLKDLLPIELLNGGKIRIVAVEGQEPGAARLSLNDGSSRVICLPEATAGPDRGPGAALVIINASQVLTMDGPGVGVVDGGAVVCQDGKIVEVLARSTGDALREYTAHSDVVDARGGVVTPGLIDPHTHPVFAGQRAVEFGMKAEGRSYLEIHKAGGGIFSTVRSTAAASFDELCDVCAGNLDRLLSWGVTTCEAKSGYALSVEGELRLLDVLRTVGGCHPVDLEPTLLGAHALPPDYAADRRAYVDLVAEEMVPRAAKEGLARHCDAYCEDGAFTTEEVEKIFSAAAAVDLSLRLHAEQFTDQGGAQLAARLGARSADHLEAISPAGIDAMASAGTTAVILPGAALSCRCPWPPARDLLDAGVHVALGTDLNPGSSMTASLPLMMSLACMQLGMSCEEAWRAVTVEAARSLGLDDRGRIAPGLEADLAIFAAADYRYVPYHYGENHIRTVVKRGRVVWPRSPAEDAGA